MEFPGTLTLGYPGLPLGAVRRRLFDERRNNLAQSTACRTGSQVQREK